MSPSEADPLYLLSKHFWAAALVVTLVNWWFAKRRAAEQVRMDPESAAVYAKLLRGYLFWMSLPWIVMGIGTTIGGVPSDWHYLRPQDGDPFVLAFFGVGLFCLILGTYWIFMRQGAETLARYPGFLQLYGPRKRTDVTSPALIKALWRLLLLSSIAAHIAVWNRGFELPIAY